MSVSLIDGHIDRNEQKMKDDEIIEALKCCVTYKQICPETCPMVGVRQCTVNLRKKSLDLINRQKEQIEALIAGQETLQKALNEKIAEIERLKYNLEAVLNERADHTEAVKEFAKKVKAEARYFAANVTDVCEIIDNIVEEMVGEK